ncbi:hypothetical protein CHS0354_011366 [Potamilus streckersoni]|uniref:Uncharacterized protein n=1 Tax=Potamilus streckersoni TaxID=2493646 RepID=A0AAE0T6L7_9BIVA|nr:hypothetical protein CHS0354_011366 [Potamilus streckersoni]
MTNFVISAYCTFSISQNWSMGYPNNSNWMISIFLNVDTTNSKTYSDNEKKNCIKDHVDKCYTKYAIHFLDFLTFRLLIFMPIYNMQVRHWRPWHIRPQCNNIIPKFQLNISSDAEYIQLLKNLKTELKKQQC